MNTTDEDIRKKEKKLDRNHWMCRIQKYTFNIDAPTFYMGYCPFFWMTWVSLLALPVVFICKTFYKFSSSRINPVLNHMEQRKMKHKTNLMKIPLEPSWEIILSVYNVYPKCHGSVDRDIEIANYIDFSSNRIIAERYRQWFLQNPNWRDTHVSKAREARKEYFERIQRENEKAKLRRLKREARSRKLASMASFCGRGLFKILIPSAIITLGVSVYYGLCKLFAMMTLQGVIGAFVIVCSLFSLALFIKIAIDFFSTVVFTRSLSDKIRSLLFPIFGDDGIAFKVFDAIRNFFSFARDTVKFTYKAECPLIVWGEETGNITRRKK